MKNDKVAVIDATYKNIMPMKGAPNQANQTNQPQNAQDTSNDGSVDCDEIEEAYGKLFEGLSMLAYAHVNEEHQEEGEPPVSQEAQDNEQDDNQPNGQGTVTPQGSNPNGCTTTDCKCPANCTCGDCKNC